MKLRIEFNKQKTIATVHVSVPLRAGREPKRQYDTSDVIEELAKQGHEVLETMQGIFIINISDRRRKGIAIFKVLPPHKKKAKKTKKKPVATRKIRKSSGPSRKRKAAKAAAKVVKEDIETQADKEMFEEIEKKEE